MSTVDEPREGVGCEGNLAPSTIAGGAAEFPSPALSSGGSHLTLTEKSPQSVYTVHEEVLPADIREGGLSAYLQKEKGWSPRPHSSSFAAASEHNVNFTVYRRDVEEWRREFLDRLSREEREREMSARDAAEARARQNPFKRNADFHTVDWRHEWHTHKARQKQIEEMRQRRCCGALLRYWYKAEGWVACALIGVMAAISAAISEVGVSYFSDVRSGTCDGGSFWFDQRLCCGSDLNLDLELNSCQNTLPHPDIPVSKFEPTDWQGWSALARLPTSSGFFLDYAMFVVIGGGMAVLAAVLCRSLAPAAAGGGIAEVKVILGGFVMKGVLGGWVLIVKSVGLVLAVASGLALGQEGPMVHLSCCWANLVSRVTRKYHDNEAKKRELLAAAAAAGIAVAFGAPLGGVLFSLEELCTYFPPKTLYKSFFCAVVGVLVLKGLDAKSEGGSVTVFDIDYVEPKGTWQLTELVFFALIGVLGGLLGSAFIYLNIQWLHAKKKLPQLEFIRKHPIMEVAVVAVVTCSINFLFPLMKIPSKGQYADAHYRTDANLLIRIGLGACLKFIQTVFTIGLFLPCGLFVPSMVVGALYGRLIGLLVQKLETNFHFFPKCNKCIQPGIYAMAGAAAMLGGVTRMTIALVVIMFEVTGGLEYVAPFMVAVMIAKWVGDALILGINECMIKLKGYPFLEKEMQPEVTFTARACDIMDTALSVIPLEGNTLGSLEGKLRRHDFHGFPLVTTQRDLMLLGFVRSRDLKRALREARRKHPEADDSTVVRFSGFESSLRRPPSPSRTGGEVRPDEDTGEETGRRRGLTADGGLLLGEASNLGRAISTRLSRRKQAPDQQVTPSDAQTGTNRFARRGMQETNRQRGGGNTGISYFRGLDAVETAGGAGGPSPSPSSSSGDGREREREEGTDALPAPSGSRSASPLVIDLSDIVDDHPLQLVPEAPLVQVYNLFTQLGLRFVLLTRHGRLEGILTKKNFLYHVELAHPTDLPSAFHDPPDRFDVSPAESQAAASPQPSPRLDPLPASPRISLPERHPPSNVSQPQP
uniref:Chloride channel protein n=1 Tax=Chromera velia CCMP2878 TaxID=1169474 RepID=A0A0G4FPU8_9ALVE|eukprot:Cvel_18040.t1-p1 / transcript=Cvel_18040.t1 / gene=Cvel_18040 / organism=Chromera_velia_CCMP2878 / gene_product=H( )/Cl(-) exchange transporter 3, putative / transcript_product=H( )/Cl(-) exchange transporter 3, putative / location=Cvel_scaffold1473:21066-27638(-) / protein_length=1043 / sequence_SO=supercontig / SO=protein_coding / is_pseudo=false